jgi:hypothetical protein
MSLTEAAHRGWVLFGLGWVFLALTVLQIWTGKTREWGGGTALRKDQPVSFWTGVFLTAAICLWCWWLGVPRITGISQ